MSNPIGTDGQNRLLAAVRCQAFEFWRNLQLRGVMRVDTWSLPRHVFGWASRSSLAASRVRPHVRGLVDTAPLRRLLLRVLPQNGDGEIAGVAGGLVANAQLTTTTNGAAIQWSHQIRRGAGEGRIDVHHVAKVIRREVRSHRQSEKVNVLCRPFSQKLGPEDLLRFLIEKHFPASEV